ncbi:MAG: hypothetical protein HFH68_13025 [Lachnospiraceae bacterium]|nr:hypothetical protein [Lachnospiraceae bacterium]
MRRKFFIAASVLFVLLFVLFPDISSRGAENGLLLWFNVIIPSLCPFMIMSTMLIKLDVTSFISNMFYPVFHRVFRLSKNGCYPAITGMLSGYPLGAKTVSDMYKTGAFSKSEAQYIISFCNNASPMFMLEYTGIKCLGLKQPAIMLVIIYMSAFINALFERNKTGNIIDNKPVTSTIRKKYPLIEALDESILSSAVTLVKVGGYIILFSILTELLKNMVTSNEIIKIAGAGILEITTGCEVLAGTSLPLYIKCILASAFCAFGGMSSVAQTSSALIGTGLSNRKYIFAKSRQAVIAALLSAVIFKFVL